MPAIPSPIFFLSTPRSYTTVISSMLGQHPEAYGVPELNLFLDETVEEFIQRRAGLFQFHKHGILRTVAELYAGEQSVGSIDMARRWLFQMSHESTAAVYRKLCQKIAPLRIVDKSPGYSHAINYLERIRQSFPDAYYLHLVRHPRTQGKSLMAFEASYAYLIQNNSMDKSTGTPIPDPQIIWHRIHSLIVRFSKTIPSDRFLRLRGEDILNHPREYFEKICHWSGLSWHEAAFEAMLHPEKSSFACFGPFGAETGNDVNFLKSPTFQQRTVASSHLAGPLPWRPDQQGLFPHVQDLARDFGYE